MSGCIDLLYLSKAGKRGGSVIEKWLISGLHFCLLVLVQLGWQKRLIFFRFWALTLKSSFWLFDLTASSFNILQPVNLMVKIFDGFVPQLLIAIARKKTCPSNLVSRESLSQKQVYQEPTFLCSAKNFQFLWIPKNIASSNQKVSGTSNAKKWPFLKILKQNWRLFSLNVKNIFSPI